ncbi:MAG: CHAP domain-containing protein [Acidimicrobiales bacterium]
MGRTRRRGAFALAALLSWLTLTFTPFGLDAEAATQGTVSLNGSGWLGGRGVDVMANGANSTSIWGNSFAVTPNGQSVYAGYEWQCVELVNRLYLTKGWITTRWEGNGGQMFDTAPVSLKKEPQGSVSWISPGDVVVLRRAGGPGHVGVVNTVTMNADGSRLVQTVNENVAGVYATMTLKNGAITLNGWASYAPIGVVHAPLSPPANPLPAGVRAWSSGLPDIAAIKSTVDGRGFYLLGRDGSVHAFGSALPLGNAALPHPGITMAVTRTGAGYWVIDTNGCTQSFGDAPPLADGGLCSTRLNGPIVDASVTPDGLGYWLVASDGGIFAVGDAPFAGSMGAQRLNAPVVSLASTVDGSGYWEIARDGGVFCFGAPFLGSTGGKLLNQPIVGAVPSGDGYLMVAADGGVFTYGNGYFGSLGATVLPTPVVATAVTADAGGYWMVDVSGNVYAFGDAWLSSS